MDKVLLKLNKDQHNGYYGTLGMPYLLGCLKDSDLFDIEYHDYYLKTARDFRATTIFANDKKIYLDFWEYPTPCYTMNAYNADFKVALRNGIRDFGSRHEGAVPPHHEENADIVDFQAVDHAVDILSPPRRSQYRSPHVHDGRHPSRRQIDKVVVVLRDESFQAMPHAVNDLDSVAIVQFQDDGADDIVQSGAQTAAGGYRAS